MPSNRRKSKKRKATTGTARINPTRYQLFSSTDHPIGHDTRLWRYLTLEKFLWLLETSQLYHPRLDCLGDPFEGSVTKKYAQMRAAGELPRHLQGRPPEFAEKMEPTIFKRLMYTRFATCWYASTVESAAMWKLYSTEHAGVAVITTPELLQASVDVTQFYHAILAPVEYLDFETDDMTFPLGKSAQTGLLKRKSFEHEREVRGLVHLKDEPEDPCTILSPERVESLKTKLPRGVNAPVDLKRLVQAIYISPLAQPFFAELVRISANRRGLGDRVRRSALCGEPVY